MQQSLRAVEKKPLPHMLCTTNMLLHGIEDPSFVRHDNTLARPYVSYGSDGSGRHRAHQSAVRREGGSWDRVQLPVAIPDTRDRGSLSCADHPAAEARRPSCSCSSRRLALRRGREDSPEGAADGGVQPPHHRAAARTAVFKPYASIGTNLLFFEKGEPTTETWFYEHRVPEGQKAYSMTKPIRVEHLQGCVDWWGGTDVRDESRPRSHGRSRLRGQGARLQPRHQESARRCRGSW